MARGESHLQFSHAAVSSPGFFAGVGGRDRSFLFVSCKDFYCESVNNGSGAGSLCFATLIVKPFWIAAGMPQSALNSAAMALLDSSNPSVSF